MLTVKIKFFLVDQKSIITLLGLTTIASLLNPQFFSINNIFNILQQTSVNAVIAVGMMLVILTAGIDLAVGSMLALSGTLIASLITAEISLFWVFLIPLFASAALGASSGVFIAKGKLQPFIVTLVMMMIIRGVTLVYADGTPITLDNSDNSALFDFIAIGSLFGIPIPIWIMALIFIFTAYILTCTRLGRHIYAIGGNEAAAALAGINTGRVKMIVYSLSGLCCFLASIIEIARLSSAQPNAGMGYEIDAIAAVVLGGTSMSGGKGNVLGTLIGALTLGLINNALNLLNYNSYQQMIIKGIIILIAVLIDNKTSE